MKKKIVNGLISMISIVGIGLSGIGAAATQVDNANTDVGIGFTAHGPGEKDGPLQIQWAPLALDFATANNVNTVAQSFSEKNNTNRYVVVNDARVSAPTNEWKLSAGLDDLTSPTAGVSALTGAKLEFNAAVQGYTGTAAPEAPGSIVSVAGQTAILASSAVAIPADSTQAPTAIMEDKGVAGAFTGATAMEMSNIELAVPGGIAQPGEQYSATIVWSLDDTI